MLHEANPRDLLPKIDNVWFDRFATACTPPTKLHVTRVAMRRAVHEVRMAVKHTPGQEHRIRHASFERYGPCEVVADLPDDSRKPFRFE